MITKLKTFFARACRACSRAPLFLWCSLVFLAAVAVRVHFIAQKENFHCDESMSVTLCSVNSPFKELDGKVFSGKEVKDSLYGNAAGVKDFAEDIFHLRENNHDLCHTNFYYSLLRCALYGADSTNMNVVVRRGFGLNLLLFSVGFVFLGLLLRELFGEKKLAIVAGLAAGTLCTGGVSMSMWLRPYELSITAFLFFSLVFVRCAKAYFRGVSLFSWKNFWLLAVAVAGTLLSVYFAVVFVILLGAALIVLAKKKTGGGITEAPFLFSVFASGVVVATAIYPNYPLGFLVGRGAEAAGKFSPMRIFSNLADSALACLRVLTEDAMLVPVAVLLAAAIIAIARERGRTLRGNAPAFDAEERTRIRLFASLFVPAALAFAAIMYFAPYKILRYVSALLPILLLVVPATLSFVRSRRIYVVGNAVFIVAFVAVWPFAKPVPMVAASDTSRRGNVEIGVRHLVYRDAAEGRKTLSALADECSDLVFIADWRLHGMDMMKIPDNARCAFVERTPDTPNVFDVSSSVPAAEKFALIIPVWTTPPDWKILLPRGKISEEIRLSSGGVAYFFERDEFAPSGEMLCLNENASIESESAFYARQIIADD